MAAESATDAYGRARSSRNRSTGPGSRGGHWHEPAFRAAYWRAWRRTHPDYRARERTRSIRKRLIARIVAGRG